MDINQEYNERPEYLPECLKIDENQINQKIEEITQWLSITTINALNPKNEVKKIKEENNKVDKEDSFKDKNPENYNRAEKESLEKIENFLNIQNNESLDNKRVAVLFLDFLYKNENLNIWQKILPILYNYFVENWTLKWWEENIRKILNPAEWENIFSQLLLHFNNLKKEDSQEISKTISDFIKSNPVLKLWINNVWILYDIYNEFKNINSDLAKKELIKRLGK